ncbi:response regulator transcription factor [Lysinibacillus sp. NPDC048646]|uniref:response regulator transcription factor n=1 Tax=Lysinibacillus sp. NPDC048646 TaxID=3390574 RepID=UPI003D01101B
MKQQILESDVIISDSDKTILFLISKEYTNKQLASELNYSERMIEHKINKLFRKFNVCTRVGLVSKAFQLKILSIYNQNIVETHNIKKTINM